MKKLHVQYFMMLTFLSVGSYNLIAMDSDVEIQRRHEDNTFLGQMHRLQNQMTDIRHNAKECPQSASNEKLDIINMEIVALDKNPKFTDVNLHDTHINTLERDLKKSRKYVKKYGMKGNGVKVQGLERLANGAPAGAPATIDEADAAQAADAPQASDVIVQGYGFGYGDDPEKEMKRRDREDRKAQAKKIKKAEKAQEKLSSKKKEIN